MEFKLVKVEMQKVMPVGDALSKLDRIGKLPTFIANKFKQFLKTHDQSSLFLGRVVFEDGRVFWAVTVQGLSKRNPDLFRTWVFDFKSQVFSQNKDMFQTFFVMEAKREEKIVRSVMNC